MRTISILVMTVILLLSLANQVSADSGKSRFEIKEVDGYKVKLAFVDGDVQLGHNKLHVLILDSNDQPLGGMLVNVIAEHYAESAGKTEMNMSGMQSTSATSDTDTPIQTVKAKMISGMETGSYESVIELAESGHWMIKVSFPVQQGQKTAVFDFDVNSGSYSFIIWIFAGINALIIVGAFIARQTRRKKATVVEAQA